jgi:hypothetical protein
MPEKNGSFIVTYLLPAGDYISLLWTIFWNLINRKKPKLDFIVGAQRILNNQIVTEVQVYFKIYNYGNDVEQLTYQKTKFKSKKEEIILWIDPPIYLEPKKTTDYQFEIIKSNNQLIERIEFLTINKRRWKIGTKLVSHINDFVNSIGRRADQIQDL